jgi:hypothetical protein
MPMLYGAYCDYCIRCRKQNKKPLRFADWVKIRYTKYEYL